MSDHQSSSEDDESPETKLRVSFILSPSVRGSQREVLELPTEPMAVPASIRKKGLSAVVNHLLDRKVPKEDDGSGGEENDSDDDDDEDKLPAIPFDFLLNDKLLRLPLESAARRERLSTERALELQYFPARPPPRKNGDTDRLPDWITAMDCCVDNRGGGEGGDGTSMLFAGGADGVVRAFSSPSESNGGSDLKQTASVSAHAGHVKCLSAVHLENHKTTLVATGSMDQTLVTHVYRSGGSTLDLHAVYTGGHANSIGSVALVRRGDKTIMASGDWDGGLAIWAVPSASSSQEEDIDERDENMEGGSKRRKGRGGVGAESKNVGAINVREVKPIQSVKAHSSNLSGLAWGYGNKDNNTLLTGSWDHGLKVYDVNRMDCILALNGSRVVTSLDRCSNSDVVATSSPDCTVRLWDMRTNGDGSSASGGSGLDKSLRQSHKAWVSSVRWSPTDPFVLASTSHDGTLKVWDIRSSLPLHTVRAMNEKGEKALCLSFGDGFIYSGGSDCAVKRFAFKI